MSAAKIAHRTLRQDVNRDYTHLQVPFTALRESFADRRFLVAALALNFVIVPPVAFGLSQLAPAGRAVELGVLMVLLTPCIDYVIVLHAAGGRKRPKLLAAAPLLMLAPLRPPLSQSPASSNEPPSAATLVSMPGGNHGSIGRDCRFRTNAAPRGALVPDSQLSSSLTVRPARRGGQPAH